MGAYVEDERFVISFDLSGHLPSWLPSKKKTIFHKKNYLKNERYQKKKMVEDEWRGIFFPFSWYRRQLNSTRVAAHRWQEPTNNFTCPIFCVRSISTDTCAYAIGDVLEEKETNWIRGIQFLRNDMNKIPRNTKKIMNFCFKMMMVVSIDHSLISLCFSHFLCLFFLFYFLETETRGAKKGAERKEWNWSRKLKLHFFFFSLFCAKYLSCLLTVWINKTN